MSSGKKKTLGKKSMKRTRGGSTAASLSLNIPQTAKRREGPTESLAFNYGK